MKKTILVIMGLALIIWQVSAAAPAKADYFNYPCQPPGVGTGVQIHVIVDASGQFCDGPTEINLSHYHCESGGGGVNGGAIGLAPSIGGLTIGGFGGSGLGGGGEGCSWRCPDNTPSPAPNPPGVGAKGYLDVRSVIKLNKAFCVREGHLVSAGPTSDLVNPDEGMPPNKDIQPWQEGDPSISIPVGIKPDQAAESVPDPQETQGKIPVPIPSSPPIPLPGGVTVPSIP